MAEGMTKDEKYMMRCLELAAGGFGHVSPNPVAGAVIVYDDRIIGEGYHQLYGGSHAEVNAIRSVKDPSLLQKATLYVNLEPCSHYGKTPPCADFIIEKKIPRVVIGTRDTNPVVAGKGIEKLQKSGIEVKERCLEEKCREINRRFFTYHEQHRPYVILKWAQSADGLIDGIRTPDTPPSWLTDETARAVVHKWRSEEDAVCIGTRTAVFDNPRLNVRQWKGKNPVRIVLDRTLRLPSSLYLFDGSQPTLVFTEKEKEDIPGVEYITVPFDGNLLTHVLRICHARRFLSVMVEGGAILINAFVNEGLWDEARVFYSQLHLGKGVPAPVLKDAISREEIHFPNSVLKIFYHRRHFYA